jgi:lipid A 3-O-deacylase
MENKKSRPGALTIQGALLLSLFAGCTAASADQFGVQLGAAISDHDVKKGDLGFVWDPNLTWWYFGGFHFTVVGEAHVGVWHYSGSNAVNQNIVEVGAQPMFRIIKDSGSIRPYFEAGAGVRFLSHPTVASDYTLSTAFQFTEVVGLGAQFGGRQQYQAGFRLQHISNADIKRPNPGINFSQLYLQYNF